MTLRRKTLLVLGLTLAAIAPAIYGIFRFTMLRSFHELEEHEMRQNMQRASRALDNELSILSTTARDDSMWDEAYDYVQHPNTKFGDATFSDDSYFSLHLNLVIVLDSAGNVLYSEVFDAIKERHLGMPRGM